jgi:S-formylglutathione hydrolase FrmB
MGGAWRQIPVAMSGHAPSLHRTHFLTLWLGFCVASGSAAVTAQETPKPILRATETGWSLAFRDAKLARSNGGFVSSAPAMSAKPGVTAVEFKSPSLGILKRLTVVLPRSYAAEPGRKYPVAYFLDGYGGSDARWARETPLAQMVDQFDIIAACPDGTANSWYCDSPIHPEHKYETFIFKDVVEYMDRHYRTRAQPGGRAITGLSMGGHGAMFVGLRHPEVFGTVASMSGGLDLRPFPESWEIKRWLGDVKTNRANWETHTVINVLEGVKPGRQNIWFDCGQGDFFLDMNRRVHEKMEKLGLPHLYAEYPGGHDWSYWNAAVERQMAFFDASFRDGKQRAMPPGPPKPPD